MNGDLAQFLEGLTSLATETAVWGNGRFPLEITYYLSIWHQNLMIILIRTLIFCNWFMWQRPINSFPRR